VQVFGSVGFPELLFIFVIALLLFGPRQLPNIGKSLGRALGEFRRASNDFKRTIEEEVAADEIKSVERELRQTAAEVKDAVTADPTKNAEEPKDPEQPSGSKEQESPTAEGE